ncbi:MAG: hypothetical protein U9O89_07375 [Thermoproteota archaeon]|nr:hypothetical protein [Thermoproteota archaeon]
MAEVLGRSIGSVDSKLKRLKKKLGKRPLLRTENVLVVKAEGAGISLIGLPNH